jgi:uncharacterized protein
MSDIQTAKSKRLVLAGGSGLLGRLLARALAARGYEITVLTRSPQGGGHTRYLPWDARTLGEWRRELEGAVAVINLAGRSVNCRYNAANRRLIMDSRVLSTRVLGEAIAACAEPPPTWLNASTATIYKHSFDRVMDETGEIASDEEANDEFSLEVAQTWEQALAAAPTAATRKIPLRIGIVFSGEPGTVFSIFRRLVRLGLGGSMAGGRQYVSWIHQEDFCRAVEWILDHRALGGPVNIVAPNPVTNREMMAVFRQVCGLPIGLPAARWMLEIGAFFMRTESELMIKSRRVVPAKLIDSGFQFRFPTFQGALEEIEGRL